MIIRWLAIYFFFFFLYVKTIINSTVCNWYWLGKSQNMKMHQILLCIWSITNVDWYSGFIYIYLWRWHYSVYKISKACYYINLFYFITFPSMWFLITYSCTAPFYHNVVNAQWQRAKTSETKNTVGPLKWYDLTWNKRQSKVIYKRAP